MSEIRDVKLDIVENINLYKATSAFKIPKNVEKWLKCPNCKLYPLAWEFDNGRYTACGCGRNEYDSFSICSESIMSHMNRHNGSALGYDADRLRKNWNYWVETGEILEGYEYLRQHKRW